MTAHPTYPHSTIIEALCEVRFQQSQENSWHPRRPGRLFQMLQPDYPEVEPITEQNIGFTVGPDGIPVPQAVQPRLKLRLTHKEQLFHVLASEQTFAISALKPYPGWEVVKAELRAIWPKFIDLVRPLTVLRIGMRYINRVPRRAVDEVPGYWLKETKYIPKAFLTSQAGYSLRLQSRLDPHNRVIITIAHDSGNSPQEPHGSLIFDIDRIAEEEMAADVESIDQPIEQLHDDIWSIFNDAKTAGYERLLNGE